MQKYILKAWNHTLFSKPSIIPDLEVSYVDLWKWGSILVPDFVAENGTVLSANPNPFFWLLVHIGQYCCQTNDQEK